MSHKLGAKRSKPDGRDLEIARYAKPAPIPVPTLFGFGHSFVDGQAGWKMLGNGPDDEVERGFEGAGDCVLASAAHQTMVFNISRHGTKVAFNGAGVIDDYSAVTGYVLDDEATDNGTEPRDALKYRKATGVVDAAGKRHKIAAYAAVDPGDWDLLRRCVYEFDIVEFAFDFPNSAWDQFDQGVPWDDVDDDQIDGGHDVCFVGSDHDDHLTCVTWAKRQVVTKAFIAKYAIEAWVPLSEETIRGDGKGPHGWDWSRLQKDLAAL
jgi:hypothetical protein